MNSQFRLSDFNVYNNSSCEPDSDDDSEFVESSCDTNTFKIQMFGVNEIGETCSIIAEDFKPFFYVKVPDDWRNEMRLKFFDFIKSKLGKYYSNSMCDCSFIKRKKLYGFDGGKDHRFIVLKFLNTTAFNKAKNIWYYTITNKDGTTDRRLMGNGLKFSGSYLALYEANIPPLLRFFHINEISPSGWVSVEKGTLIEADLKTTSCAYEYVIKYKNIIALNENETRVPYKICSFDIEASSSHGDFPLPIKTYKKLATNIVDCFSKLKFDITPTTCKNFLKKMVLCAFGYDSMAEIDLVYPKTPISKEDVLKKSEKWFLCKVRDYSEAPKYSNIFGPKITDECEDDDEGDDESAAAYYPDKAATIIDILCNKKFEREGKITELTISFKSIKFPELEGDKVTFIGSTFLRYGDKEPYLNNCIVLNSCDALPNTEIETYSTEKDVLCAWKNLIQRENPDIIIGYNIFGFDYEFMFRRSIECDCVEEFLKLSRNVDEVCGTRDPETSQYKIEESQISIASGTYELHFIKINGRFQIDMYNYFRREENLTSYKLDYVAGYFIGDYVKDVIINEADTTIKTFNMTGLLVDSFIHFEEISHTTEYYNNGAKFRIIELSKEQGWFKIRGQVTPNMGKKVRWCLAKDDVTPKDIFRMTNGSSADRGVIAKYCIQDCNLVHYLVNKVDVITGLVEMSKICSVPLSFLILRGQGIKLTSYVAKKCREKRTLMPVIEKGNMDDGYEGAIVLEPKCDLYLDIPVACVDYASLYPSCMLSENISHDSKVWSKEYDLGGELVRTIGEKNLDGTYKYDNLSDYEYVDIRYDTYRYVRKTPKSTALKVLSGYKVCRFAQFKEGLAIMPSILEELLSARKSTRKLIPAQTDEFMKNVLDKRQLAYKVTANSLYGQCGAKTSTFYEQDIAAATTATGRLLLTYGKRIIEECYGNNICESKYGQVLTKAEYIYGDTDSVFFTFNLSTPEGVPIRGERALEITIELAKEAGHLASNFLKGPHDLEYEKTFMPFCLLSKKRYVGMLYENDHTKGKRKEMGIVLKRRDNAPIVKEIYGGIIDILMKTQNITHALEFLNTSLDNIVNERVSIDKLIITKSLNSAYKNPNQIAHKVLANRITEREPGNKPTSGDRIPFIYIHSNNKSALQGEKIETPTFIRENKLKIDYSFYITNQIMKPLQQLFALVLENIWVLQKKQSKIAQFKRDVETIRRTSPYEKIEERIDTLKNKEVKSLLFDEYLRKTNNEKMGNQDITKWFGSK